MSSHISSPDAPYPTPASATTTHAALPFLITTRKLPILKSGPIDALTSRLGIPIPEMIFGDNLVSITHLPSQWTLSFSAEPALALVDATGANMLRVAHASSWSSSREASGTVAEVVRPYDWSYSTSYRGTEVPGGGGEKLTERGGEEIPLELLRRRDPILFHDEVVLYESELDDNGVSVVSVKVRAMERRMLVLCRQYMRLDGVVARVRDTRVYVDFGEERVVREYTAREGGWEGLRNVSLFDVPRCGRGWMGC